MSEETREMTVQNDQIALVDGEIDAVSLQQLNRAASYLASSGMLPKQFDTAPKVAVGMLMCKELGLKSIISLRNIAVINGSPSLWGELPLAIVRMSGLLKYFREYCIDANYLEICIANKNLGADIFSSVCEIQREECEMKTFTYTKMDALANPNSSGTVWKAYRSIMMKRKCRSLAIKDEFGDLLGGCSIAEYDHDVIPSEDRSYAVSRPITRSTGNDKTKAINEKLSSVSEELPPPAPTQEASTDERGNE